MATTETSTQVLQTAILDTVERLLGDLRKSIGGGSGSGSAAKSARTSSTKSSKAKGATAKRTGGTKASSKTKAAGAAKDQPAAA